MSTCLDIVRRALLSAEGRREVPGGADGALAMMRLQDVILTLPLLMDGGWREVFLAGGVAEAAQDGDRIHADATNAISLPLRVADDGGAVVAQRDLSRLQVFGDNPKAGLWIYAAGNGAWRRADGLTLASDSPFGPQDDAGLAALLAVALAGDGGGSVPPDVVGLAGAALSSFSARFYRPINAAADPAWLRLSDTGWRASCLDNVGRGDHF